MTRVERLRRRRNIVNHRTGDAVRHYGTARSFGPRLSSVGQIAADDHGFATAS